MKSQEPLKRKRVGTRKPKVPKMSAQEYFEVLKGVALDDLYLEECASQVKKEIIEASGELPFTWNDEVPYEIKSSNRFRVKHRLELVASPGKGKDFVLKISCTFVLDYSSKQELSADFLTIFADRNVRLNTWPYFRELVQSMTQRMNLTPLVLPLLV